MLGGWNTSIVNYQWQSQQYYKILRDVLYRPCDCPHNCYWPRPPVGFDSAINYRSEVSGGVVSKYTAIFYLGHGSTILPYTSRHLLSIPKSLPYLHLPRMFNANTPYNILTFYQSQLPSTHSLGPPRRLFLI